MIKKYTYSLFLFAFPLYSGEFLQYLRTSQQERDVMLVQELEKFDIEQKSMQQVLEAIDAPKIIEDFAGARKKLELEFMVALADKPWDASMSIQEYTELIKAHMAKIEVINPTNLVEYLRSPDRNISSSASDIKYAYFGSLSLDETWYNPVLMQKFNALCDRLTTSLMPEDFGDDYAEFIHKKDGKAIDAIAQDVFAATRVHRYLQAAAATQDLGKKRDQIEKASSILEFADPNADWKTYRSPRY